MSSSSVLHHFNTLAKQYDSYKHEANLYYNSLKKAVKLHVAPQKAVLDIGCGTGTILALTQAKKGVGIDISPEMIRLAKQKHPQHNFWVHDIEKRPVTGSFDYIVCTDVIEHLQHPQSALKNIARSMSLQTTLILSMANPFWEPVLMLLEKLRLKMPEGPHRRISESNLLQLLQSNKLTVLNKQVYFPHIPLPIITNVGLIYVYTIKKIR